MENEATSKKSRKYLVPICCAENGKNNTSISQSNPDISCSFTSSFPGTSLAEIFRGIFQGRNFHGPLLCKVEWIQSPGNFPSLEFGPELPRGELQKIPRKNKESAWNFSVKFCGFSGLLTCIVNNIPRALLISIYVSSHHVFAYSLILFCVYNSLVTKHVPYWSCLNSA